MTDTDIGKQEGNESDKGRRRISPQVGTLTLEEREDVTDWINKKAVDPSDPCPHCGSSHTEVQEQVFHLSAPVADMPGNMYWSPFATVVCFNCGFLRLFNLMITGTFEKPPQTDLATTTQGGPDNG